MVADIKLYHKTSYYYTQNIEFVNNYVFFFLFFFSLFLFIDFNDYNTVYNKSVINQGNQRLVNAYIGRYFCAPSMRHKFNIMFILLREVRTYKSCGVFISYLFCVGI